MGGRGPFAQVGDATTVDVFYEGTTLTQVTLDGPNLWLGVVDLP